MQKRLLTSVLFSCVLFQTSTLAAEAENTYTYKAPTGCLDKEIVKNHPVSLIDLIKIGICNNPSLNADYMGLIAESADLGAAKAEYFPEIDLSTGLGKNTSKNQGSHHLENDPYNINLGLSWLL